MSEESAWSKDPVFILLSIFAVLPKCKMLRYEASRLLNHLSDWALLTNHIPTEANSLLLNLLYGFRTFLKRCTYVPIFLFCFRNRAHKYHRPFSSGASM